MGREQPMAEKLQINMMLMIMIVCGVTQTFPFLWFCIIVK